MQPTIPGQFHGSPQAFHPQSTVPPAGQPSPGYAPAPASGTPGGQGSVPAMVTPPPSSQPQAWGGTSHVDSSSFATQCTIVFYDEVGQEVSTIYNTMREEIWKSGLAPESRLAALMSFRSFCHQSINNSITLLRFDIAMDLMDRAPNDYGAVARALRPLVNSEIPSFYDGFLPFGVTVANANMANVDFGANALQTEMVFLPAQGPLLPQPQPQPQPQYQPQPHPRPRPQSQPQSRPQSKPQPQPQPSPQPLPPSPQLMQSAVRQHGMSPPSQKLTSPPSPLPSYVPPARDIVPRHSVPRLVLISPGQTQEGKQPTQKQ